MRYLLYLALSVILCGNGHAAAIVVGTFDTGRAGPASIGEGPVTHELRSALISAYPGSSFVGVNSLTEQGLAAFDLLIVGAPTFNTPIFLTPEEQTALLNFVRSGGGAIIYFDNDSYAGVPASDDAAETFLDPFGLDATGRTPGVLNATTSAPEHPIAQGPFGQVTTFTSSFAGWVDNPGPHAVPLMNYDFNGQPAIAAFGRDVLSPGAGGVVFFGDADALVDSAAGGWFGAADNRTLFLNSVDYVIPEPTAISMLLVAGALYAGHVRRRKKNR